MHFLNWLRTAIALFLAIVADNIFYFRVQQWVVWLDVLPKQSIVLANVFERLCELFFLVAEVFFSSFLQSFVFYKTAWIVTFEDRPGNQQVVVDFNCVYVIVIFAQ
jgi:hypothetical protein